MRPHLRHTRWVKNDDPSAPINNKPELTANGKPVAQNRWIAYNKMRGQAEEHMGILLLRAKDVGWIPNRFLSDLGLMITETILKLKQLRPYGYSAVGNIPMVSTQREYGRTCFRVDVDNLYGTNFKE